VVAPGSIDVDPQDRESVARLERDVLKPALEVKVGWTGSVDGCIAGAISDRAMQAQLDVVNAARALAELPPVAQDPSMSAAAQSAALIMEAAGALSHYPPQDWPCWSDLGRRGAETSNLALGYRGANAVRGYLSDPGISNQAAGHRRWLLNPRLTTVGIGATSRANAITVIGGPSAAAAPGWVEWPTAGFFPVTLWPDVYSFTRWSVSYPRADFSQATVTMSQDGAPLEVTVFPVRNGYGDNTLVWDVATPDVDNGLDVRFDVVVSNVRMPDGQVVSHSYSTIPVDSDGGPPSAPRDVTAVLQPNGNVLVSWSAPAEPGLLPITYVAADSRDGWYSCKVRDALSCVIRGIPRGSRESFVVQASNSQGDSSWSDPSGRILIATVPGKVRGARSSCSGSKCDVVWLPANANGSRITRYEVQWQGDSSWRAAKGRSVSVTVPGRRAVLLLRAVNAVGTGAVVSLRLPRR